MDLSLRRVSKRLLTRTREVLPRILRRGAALSLSAGIGEWSIGLYSGPSPLSLSPLDHPQNPVITRIDVTDVAAGFVADPFMIIADKTWYMFFEVWNRRRGCGEIGLAVSGDGRRWTYRQIVLTEPFHLSYPYVFEWSGTYYMVPESYKAGAVRLYRAVDFPLRWQLERILLQGETLLDPSVFRYKHRWWMFLETDPNFHWDTLRLFYANELAGPWKEHVKSPIVSRNPHTARPAGRVLVLNDRIIRFAQDCYPHYGMEVRPFEVTELTHDGYFERELPESPLLTASGRGWNAVGMHHIDVCQENATNWIACVDGHSYLP